MKVYMAQTKRRPETNGPTKGPNKSARGISIASRARTIRPGYFKTHMGGFPQRFPETLRWAYASNAPYAVVAGTYQEVGVVLANSAYRPCAGLAATSAAGFAKWMAVYTKCYVKSARITVAVVNQFTVANAIQPSITFGITGTTNSTTLGSYVQAIETGLVDSKMLGTGNDTGKVSWTVDIGKFLSRDDVTDTSDLYCQAAADPAQLVTGHLWFYNNSATNANTNLNITVDLECIFVDPLPVA